MRQEMMRVWGCHWHQLDHMQTICTLLQTDNHTPPLNFYRPDALADTQPTVSNHWRPSCMYVQNLQCDVVVMCVARLQAWFPCNQLQQQQSSVDVERTQRTRPQSVCRRLEGSNTRGTSLALLHFRIFTYTFLPPLIRPCLLYTSPSPRD